MKILIPFLIIIIFDLSLSLTEAEEKEMAATERRIKALACSILSNTKYAYSNYTKREIKDLLRKNNIIKKAKDIHNKIFEFLRAICYKKIESYTANNLVEKVSQSKMEVLEDDYYAELFIIDPDLNFTKIKKVMKTVKRIMKKIEKEEEAMSKNNTVNKTEEKILSDKRKLYYWNKFKSNFSIIDLVKIVFSFILLILPLFAFCFCGKEEKNKIKKEKNNKEEDNIKKGKNDEEEKNINKKNEDNIQEEKDKENKENENKVKNE